MSENTNGQRFKPHNPARLHLWHRNLKFASLETVVRSMNVLRRIAMYARAADHGHRALGSSTSKSRSSKNGLDYMQTKRDGRFRMQPRSSMFSGATMLKQIPRKFRIHLAPSHIIRFDIPVTGHDFWQSLSLPRPMLHLSWHYSILRCQRLSEAASS